MTTLFPKPISPDEAIAVKKDLLPGYVIEAFNQSIAHNFDGRSATVYQGEIIGRILMLAAIAGDEGLTRDEIFNRKMLDVEPLYEAEGWKVEYDKPAYNETYEPSFRFTKKKAK